MEQKKKPAGEKVMVVLEVIGNLQVASKGMNKGQKIRKCIFKIISKDSAFFEKTAHMNILIEDDYKSWSTGLYVEEWTHYIIKRNLTIGNIFENVTLLAYNFIPENENKNYIDSFGLGTKIIRNVEK